MGSVMDEIRAEAKKRGEARDTRETQMREQQARFLDMDRKPAPATSSSAPAPPPAAGAATASATSADPLIESTGIEMPLCGCGANGEGFGTALFGLAGLRPPSEASFGLAFKSWFEEDYFPAMSGKLQQELVSRARTKGFFSGLSSQVKKAVMANTDVRLQAEVWHAYYAQHNPPKFQTYGPFRVATVNLGSVAFPCWTKFIGYQSGEGPQWSLSPFASADADISAVLDELDGRGGMPALLAAA